MVKVLLAFLLAASCRAAALDKDSLDMVQAFLKLPTDKLPTEHIARFLAVDPEALPVKLRDPYIAKRLELYTYKQIADGNKRGSVRMPEADCAMFRGDVPSTLKALRMVGFMEIKEEEELFLMKETKCTERDLMCEFTLQIVKVPGKKKDPPRLLFLHPKDPLAALITVYRTQGRVHQTNFFGMTFPSCAPRLK